MLGFELKRLFRGSVIYGVGTILQRFIGILLLPFFTNELTTEDYGVISLISLVSIALTGVFNLGTSNSIGILYFKEVDHSKRPTIIWSTVILLMCVSTVWLLFFYIAAPKISLLVFEDARYSELFFLSIIGLAISTTGEPFLAYLRMEEKSKHFSIQSLVVSLITTLSSILFILFFKWGAKGFILAGLVGQVSMVIFSFIYIVPKIRFSFNSQIFGPLINIGFPSIFGLFAFLIIDYGDRQILQRFLGLSELGIYSVGYNFGMVVMVLVNAFSASWSPFFMSFINRPEDARVVFGNVLKYYLIGFGFLSLFFFGFAKLFLTIVVAPDYIAGYKVVGLVAVGYILRGSYLILLPALYFSKKLKLQSMIECSVAIVNIALNLWLVPVFGILGAAFATVISFACLPFFTYFVSSRLLKVQYDTKRIVLGISVISITAIVLFLGTQQLQLWYGALFTGINIIIAFLLLFRLSFLDTERKFLLGKLRLKQYIK